MSIFGIGGNTLEETYAFQLSSKLAIITGMTIVQLPYLSLVFFLFVCIWKTTGEVEWYT
jgi:hypothetical protein